MALEFEFAAIMEFNNIDMTAVIAGLEPTYADYLRGLWTNIERSQIFEGVRLFVMRVAEWACANFEPVERQVFWGELMELHVLMGIANGVEDFSELRDIAWAVKSYLNGEPVTWDRLNELALDLIAKVDDYEPRTQA